MNWRGRSAVLAGTMILSLATASAAHALVPRSAESEAQGPLQVATAKCKADERVISGGYTLDQPSSSETPETSRARGERGWLVKAVGSEFTAIALCSKRLEPKQAVKKVAMTTSSRGTKAKAKCASGFRAVGGGFKLSPAVGNSPIFASKPAGRRSWSVLAVSDAGPNADLKAYAYCLKDPGAIAKRTATELAPDANDAYAARAKCRTGEELLGGGWSQSPRPDWNNSLGPDIFFGLATPTRRAFTAGGPNYSSVDGTVKAFAVCAA